MRSKRSRTTNNEEALTGVSHQPGSATIHSKETQTLEHVQTEHARTRALQQALTDATPRVAFHDRPTMLLPTISVRDGLTMTTDEISAELIIEPQDGLADEVARLHKERDELQKRMASLEQELATQREQLVDKQREIKLLLPWLPTEDSVQGSTVSCSEVLKRIEPLRDLIKRANSPSERMSDHDKVRWLLADAESAITALRKLCDED